MSQTTKRKFPKVESYLKTPRRCTEVKNAIDLLCVMERHGDRTAFTYYKGKELANLSYAHFSAMIRETAAGLDALGYAGKRIALIGESSPEWLCIYLAVLAGGGVIIPLDKELAVEEIANFLIRAKADAIAFSTSFSEKFLDLTEKVPTLQLLISFSLDETLQTKNAGLYCDLSQLINSGRTKTEYHFPDTDVNSLAEFLFTSGTTGTSKCVMLSQKNIFSVVTAAAQTVDFCPEDTVVSILPLHHTYELACTMAELDYGMHICINDSLRHLMRNFEKFQPTGLVLVPLIVNTMYKKIWSEAAKQKKTKKLKMGILLSNALRKIGIDRRAQMFAEVRQAFGGKLVKIISGGAAISPEVITAMDDFGIAVYEGYGITECAPLTCVTPYYARKCGSVGPSVPCCKVRIFADGAEVPAFCEGEIQIHGDNVMLGYCDDAEANAAAFTEDGWFRTGDVGYMDRDGYVYITGRLKSVIVLESGKNVFPEEIEEYLSHIDLIAESVVLGRKQGEHVVLTAVVYPAYPKFPPESKQEEVEAAIRKAILALNKKLPGFKQIQQVEFRNTEFEKTTTKKIKRHLVK